jgi:pullulanase
MSTDPLFHISQQLGAVQLPNTKRVQFRIYFPRGVDPHISSIDVVGPFHADLGGTFNYALTKTFETFGTLWTLAFDKDLEERFYEYQYRVGFDDGSSRLVADPCARYSGSTAKSSAFVIGGTQVQAALLQNRLATRDLVIYEMHADDFTKEFRDNKAPFDAIVDKLDDLAALGINAIEIMPWTAWKDRGFNWGYVPFQYFAVEYLYANDASKPEDKISRLKALINECHQRGIHVILDGVFNHCDTEFPYRQLYRDITNSPYTAEDFGEAFSGLQELDFANGCTQDFIRDVCLYWISEFKIDGIRFDAAKYFNVSGDHEHGIRKLLTTIDDYLQRNGIRNFTMSIEWLDIPASKFVLTSSATSYWDNDLYQECFSHLGNTSNRLSVEYFRSLNNTQYIATKDKNGNANFPNKVPTNYLSNHDHSTVAWQAGSYDQSGSVKWYRTQPHVIALLMSPGCPLFYQGSERAENYFLPEDDHGTGERVKPRPLHWDPANDKSGGRLLKLYSTLIEIRKRYAALRSGNFYPAPWNPGWTLFNEQGFGIDLDRGLIVFHRYGPVVDPATGNVVADKLDLFYVVLNFSDIDRVITLQVARNGDWTDFNLLRDGADGLKTARDFRLLDFRVESFWGHVLHMRVDV